MRSIVALLALLASERCHGAAADLSGFDGPQQRTVGHRRQRQPTFYDSMGRNTGRSVTDSGGNTSFYDSMGRNTGRSTTNRNTTTTYDNFGRRTGSIQGSR
jgi:hypothetical protein